MNGSDIGLTDADGIFTIRSFNDVVTPDFEHLTRQLADEIGIFGHEDCLRAVRRDSFMPFERISRSEEARKIDLESRALIRPAGCRDVSAAVLDGALNRGAADAGAP